MDASARATAEALMRAIKAEGDGHHFYIMAAKSSQDAKGREVFERLAEEELDHQRFLSVHYRSLLETGRIDSAARLGPRADLSGESPIFSEEIRGRLAEAHFEMSALSIGIQLELAAMGYYRDAAVKSDGPEVKRLFEELADWEAGHYRALLRQQEALRDDYWSGSGFSPF